MPDIAMGVSQKIPTARKAPVTLSPSSNGPANSQQERKTSLSQSTAKTQQQRRNSNPQSSSKVVIQQRRKSSAAEGSTLVGNKRKIKSEERSPTKLEFQVKAGEAHMGTAQSKAKTESPPKKQKIEEMKIETTQEAMAIFPNELPYVAPNPHQPPVLPSTTSQKTQMTTNLLRFVLESQPSLLPPDLVGPISSYHIDAIAHAVWQVAFKHVGMLQRACQYSAMFSPLKLAALAKLNFLPSWWFFRDLIGSELPTLIKRDDGNGEEKVLGWLIDDKEMQNTWKETVRWCAGVLGDRVAMPVGREGARKLMEAAKAEREEMEKTHENDKQATEEHNMKQGDEGEKMGK